MNHPRTLTWVYFILLCGLSMMLTACAEDTASPCADAQKEIPTTMSGTISLVFQSLEIDVDTTVKVTKRDGCRMDVELSQNLSPLCGSTFAGTLYYKSNQEVPAWEGATDESDDLNKGTKMTTQLVAKGAGQVFLKATMTEESAGAICRGQVISGTISGAN